MHAQLTRTAQNNTDWYWQLGTAMLNFMISVFLTQAVDEPDVYETDELPEVDQAQEEVSAV